MLPKFSLRTALLLLTAGTGLAIVLAALTRGEVWAACVIAAIGSAVAALLVHGLFYAAVRVFGLLDRRQTGPSPRPRASAPSSPEA